MKLIITSAETHVTFQRSQSAVFAKNQVDYELHPRHVSFKTTRESFDFEYADIQVDGVTLTNSNADNLLSAALFRNALGGSGGDNGGNLVFDDKAQLDAWLAGTYTRPDGFTPDKLKEGQIIILDTGEKLWWDGSDVQDFVDLSGFVEDVDDKPLVTNLLLTNYVPLGIGIDGMMYCTVGRFTNKSEFDAFSHAFASMGEGHDGNMYFIKSNGISGEKETF